MEKIYTKIIPQIHIGGKENPMGDHQCCPTCENELDQLSQQNDLLIGALLMAKVQLEYSVKLNARLMEQLRKEKERNGSQ